MSAADAMDPRDLDLLRRVAGGECSFHPDDGEPTNAPRWLAVVERLRRLRDRGYLRMPEPDVFYGVPGYEYAGPCELTAAAYDALEAFGT